MYITICTNMSQPLRIDSVEFDFLWQQKHGKAVDRAAPGQHTHRIHGTGIFTYICSIKINQMYVNMPYMDDMGYECRKGFPFQEFFHKNDSLRPLYHLGVAKPVLEIVSHLHTCFIIASNSDLHQNDAFIHNFPNICCSNPPKF